MGLVLLVAIGWGAWQKVQSSGGFQMGDTGGGTMGGGSRLERAPRARLRRACPPTEPPPRAAGCRLGRRTCRPDRPATSARAGPRAGPASSVSGVAFDPPCGQLGGTREEVPYCAEEIQDDAIKCRYCFSDLRADPETAMAQHRTEGVRRCGSHARRDVVRPGGPRGPRREPSTEDADERRSGSASRTRTPGTATCWATGGHLRHLGSAVARRARRDLPADGRRVAERLDPVRGLEPNHVAVAAGPAVASDHSTPPCPGAPEPRRSTLGRPGAPVHALGDDVPARLRSDVLRDLGADRPVATRRAFPRDDAGWAAAWRRFTAIETNYAEVGLGEPGSS